jgi:quinol monooxygenase YgiN/oxalate decarboxylase/phosphoglucose isomerase-like protein (cupin superfamily)
MISTRHILGHVFLHAGHDHGHGSSPKAPPSPATAAQPIYYPTPKFNKESRYDPAAPYNLAPRFTLPKGFGLPLSRNFDYASFIKTDVGNNTETTNVGLDLPLFIDLPNKPSKGSFQWDSFPAGEAQQFLVFSVTRELINNQPLYNGANNGETPVILDAISSSNTQRPFTIALSVTPYNAGPIPHIHWAEDEWFIILQGEMDSWIGDPTGDAYSLYEFPEGSEPLPSNYDGPILTSANVDTFYYTRLTQGQAVYLPRGYAHSYRNASPTGDPLVFLTIWSRSPGYPEGGIEQFFTLPDPLIGRFYDTANDAAAYGNLYNKNVGSSDGIANQQRLVDYYNTFPDYYVAMSRNFGSFTSPESAGGNWNPAIPNDTRPFGTPPPAFWALESDQPWLADPSTPGVQSYYLPPGPNAPSTRVSFATPIDPTVVQISTFTYTGANDATTIARFEAELQKISSILSSAAGAQYSLLLDPKSYGNNLSYVIQTTWNTYSALHEMQQSADLKAALTKALKSSSLSTVNNTVNSDLYADNEQIVVGRFQIADGNMNEALSLSASLKQITDQESGIISFDYYIDEKDPSTLVYIEHYESGKALTDHLLATHTTSFFAQLGPLTKSGLLADNNIGIFPVNSNISQFYPKQLQGLDLLANILAGMPDLQLSLNLSREGRRMVASVPSGSSDIGGYVSVSKIRNGGKDKTYGYFNRKSDTPVILFESSQAFSSTNDLQSILNRKIAVTAGQSLRFFSTSQSAVDIVNNGLSRSAAKLSAPGNLRIKANGDAIFNGLAISLDVPYQGARQVSSVLQTQAKPLVDLNQMPRRDITGHVHLYNKDGKRKQSLKNGDYGLYQVKNASGAIVDPITGRSIKATGSERYQEALVTQISSQHSEDAGAFKIKGGFQYAPYLQIREKIYTPYNSEVKILGANSFLFETDKRVFITSIDLHASENLPLMI